MYIADLKVAGYVKFRYRYTDPAVHFHFYVSIETAISDCKTKLSF